jgi:hypothetical protein
MPLTACRNQRMNTLGSTRWGSPCASLSQATQPGEIMLKKLAIMASMLTVVGAAFAVDMGNVAQKFDLKDGSTVYVFKDGKMAMEDRLGRTVGMKAGHVMETKDGQKIIMVGNELARLEMIKAEKRGN